jgi:hypothetical protein
MYHRSYLEQERGCKVGLELDLNQSYGLGWVRVCSKGRGWALGCGSTRAREAMGFFSLNSNWGSH